MLESIFKGIFDSEMTSVITVSDFLLCVGCALALGMVLAGVYRYRSRSTRSFVVTLALLPAVVCVVIMMVNGNVGTGVAVAGAFSLVRFRSAAGTAKEIGALFLAMAAGLIAGMGYLAYAVLFTAVLAAAWLLYHRLGLGSERGGSRTLHITVPENLNFNGVFDDLLNAYASEWELASVRTTNMGSLYKLTYDMTFRRANTEKELIDQLRCRNGNLEISVTNRQTVTESL